MDILFLYDFIKKILNIHTSYVKKLLIAFEYITNLLVPHEIP